nr:RecName: Full=36 kDa cell wall protein [Arabidopsis thaliana]
EDLPEK